MRIKELTVDLAADPFSVEKNFALAEEYERLQQHTSAAGFFLRAAEYGYKTHPLYTYASLLKMALCWSRQNDRKATAYVNLYEAMAFMPARPEAYFLLARSYEREKAWHKSFAFAELGMQCVTTAYNNPLPGWVEYNGEYCLLFEKAVASWWIGRKEESEKLFHKLLDEYKMSPEYVHGCLNNLRLFNVS